MSFRKLTMAAVAAVSLGATALPASAATILIAGQSGGPAFQAIFDATTGTTLSLVDGTVKITELGGVATSIDAFLNLSAGYVPPLTVVTPPATGSFLQEFGPGTFSVTSGTGGTGINYLSGTFNLGTFSGSGSVGGFNASTPAGAILNFTSDVFTTLGSPFGLSFSFTSITPTLTNVINGGGGTSLSICTGPGGAQTMCSWSASYSGEFSAERVGIPGPAALALFGVGLLALGAVARRKAA